MSDELLALGDGAAARTAERTRRLPSLLRPLEQRDFRPVWFGEGTSTLGDQAAGIVLGTVIVGLFGSAIEALDETGEPAERAA
ncbi:MAG: hypothetical protein ACXVAE_02710 [Candidatus Limnocylindrales bacterium]